jgi:uncharacterized protein YcnI
MSVLAARRSRTLLATLTAGIAALLILPATASAHVTVQPGNAEPGGYTRVTFRVPNERDDASTVKLEVTFPVGHPLASVSVQPVQGWTAKVVKSQLATPIKNDDGEITEAVSAITWSGGSIAPGEFQEFPVSLGPLPSAGTSLVFKSLQTYSDGEVVRWIDVPQPGADRPEHPAPTLTIAEPAVTAPPAAGAGDTDDSGPDAAAIGLGAAGLVTGLVALGVALGRRRPVVTAAQDAGATRETVQV